ncbi:alpha/beta fold hydrolase [Candidatus Woesebacteria bacterium]|nr:alpha/beta fold hydrolase [Candidatus Woesebacteria bacterium]
MTKFVAVIIGLVVVLGVAGFAVNRQRIQNFIPDITNTSTPTPMPLAELTIPHLRSRTYESALGERTKLYDRDTYSAYTTSYTSDGLKINAMLTIPRGDASKHPAIVFVHGYIPPTLYVTTEKYVEYVDYLARNGFVVLKIDLRGHGNSEGEAGGAYYSSDYVIDTLNARAALASSDFVLSDKIGLWGHSMAGNVVMRAFASMPTIPAVVVWAGAGYTYQDLIEYRISDQSYRPPSTIANRSKRRELLRQTHGDFTQSSVFWKQVAITGYLSDLKGAVDIHHAVDDDVVSVEYSRNLAKLLEETSVIHELYEYPSGGHNISGVNFGMAMMRTVDFYKKHLSQ